MVIHVIGTVNGQVNEGMRNVATHLAKEFEKDNTVLYSGLKQIPQIVQTGRCYDDFCSCQQAGVYLGFDCYEDVQKHLDCFGTEAGFGFHGEKQ